MRRKICYNLNVPALMALSILKEKKSVSETAKVLNVSQSTVSKFLAELKVEFNDYLYTKTNNDFVFSKVGDSICSASNRYLKPGIELIERIKDNKEKEFSILLPKWVNVSEIRRQLLEKFPDIDFKFTFRLVDNFNLNFICESLMNGFADVCICHFPLSKEGIQKREICLVEVVFLSKNKTHVEIEDLNSCEFIKYNISNDLFNNFLSSNNIETLPLSEVIHGVEQWIDLIDDNKIIITTDCNSHNLLAQGYTKMTIKFDMIVNYSIHLIWNAKYKNDAYVNELCKIITGNVR